MRPDPDEIERRNVLKVIGGSAIAGLAGCTGDTETQSPTADGDGNGDGSQSDEGDGNAQQQSVKELPYWHNKGKNPNWTDQYSAALPVANESLDGYEIVQKPYAAGDKYYSAIRPTLGSEDGPALYAWICGERLKNVAKKGYARDVTDICHKYIDRGAYTESAMDAYSVDGTAYSVPTAKNYWVMFYNKLGSARLSPNAV